MEGGSGAGYLARAAREEEEEEEEEDEVMAMGEREARSCISGGGEGVAEVVMEEDGGGRVDRGEREKREVVVMVRGQMRRR
jgi:hypothetical protein